MYLVRNYPQANNDSQSVLKLNQYFVLAPTKVLRHKHRKTTKDESTSTTWYKNMKGSPSHYKYTYDFAPRPPHRRPLLVVRK